MASKFDAACYWLRDHPHAVGYAAIIATILFVGRLEIIPGIIAQ